MNFVGLPALLERIYTFEAAHQLPLVAPGHKCGTLHGHSYTVTVFVLGPIRADGMVADFAEIDAVAKPVIQTLDHKPLHAIEGLQNPTSELIAPWLCVQLRAVPGLYAVRVSETARSACTVLAKEVFEALAREAERA